MDQLKYLRVTRRVFGAFVCVFACVGAAAAVIAQQAPQGRAGQAGGRGQGGGRGAPRPECVSPKIPAAECNVGAAGIQWADPPLPDGPILIESAVPAHRNLRVVVMARLQQPWSIAFLPDNNILVTERGGRLRIVRNGVLDPNPVAGVPRVHAQGLQGLLDVVL